MKAGLATNNAVQFIARGDFGAIGELAQQHVVEEHRFGEEIKHLLPLAGVTSAAAFLPNLEVAICNAVR